MKKKYMQPDTESVKIELNSLMTISNTSEDQAGEGSENAPVNYSRDFDDWDE